MRVFLLLVSISEVYCLREALGLPHRRTSSDYQPYWYLFIFVGLLIGALVRHFIKVFHLPIPYAVIIIFIGGLWGIGAIYSKTMLSYSNVAHASPDTYLLLIVPLLVFKTAFCIDVHTFLKAFGQVFIISVPAVIISTTLIGSIMHMVFPEEMPLSAGILFGSLCSPVYAFEVITLLREIGSHTKHLTVLLEGESIIGTASAAIMFEISFAYLENWITFTYQLFMSLTRFILVGLIVGCAFGFSGKLLIKYFYNDSINILSVTLAFPFISYYICEEILGTSGILSILVIGVMMSTERAALITEIDSFIVYFWKTIGHIIVTIIFLIIGIIFTIYIVRGMERQDFVLIIITYLVTNISRFVSFMVLAPILFRVGYGLTIRNLTVVVWGGLKHPISLCYVLLVYNHTFVEIRHLGRIFLMHFIGLYFLTLLINASTMRIWLNIIGLSTISMARISNMNNCMKFVLARRNRTIGLLKMNKILADANWQIVNDATNMKHPYKLKYSLDSSDEEDDDDDNVIMGYRVTQCPDCKREVLNEPTPKELKQMIKAAKMKVLKARKVSYARQFEHGMLSKEGRAILSQAIDIAMDTDEANINLQNLQKLFKIQIKPKTKFRKTCHRIVNHFYFEFVINFIILLNIIPLIVELSIGLNEQRSIYIFRSVNLFFYAVYLMEFIMKLIANSFDGDCWVGFKIYIM